MSRLREDASPGLAGRVRAMRVELHWLDGSSGFATLTVDDNAPVVLMVDGDPFVRADVARLFVQASEQPRYFEVKPYRVDAGLLEDM